MHYMIQGLPLNHGLCLEPAAGVMEALGVLARNEGACSSARGSEASEALPVAFYDSLLGGLGYL